MDKTATSGVQSPVEEIVCDFGSVKSRTRRVLWKWTIMDYSTWPKKTFELSSRTFSTESVEWCITLYNTQNAELYLCFSVLVPSKSPMVKGTLKVTMISQNGNKYEVYPTTDVNLDTVQKSLWVILNDFFKKEDGLKDMFILEGEVNIITVIANSHTRETIHRPARSVTEDLNSLLESGVLSDIVLCVGDTKLKAHRAVLAARSPVFAAMLRHDSHEAQTGIVDITDVDADVLQQVLRYIYTGMVPDTEAIADRLLVAADKYDLPHLKTRCEDVLAKSLCVDNAVAMAIFALSHNCDNLKKYVVSYIKRNISLIMGSDGWDSAMQKHAEIIRELSRLVADHDTKK